jgi:cysteine synthase
MQSSQFDSPFSRRFEAEVASRVPYYDPTSGRIVNATPLVDITASLAEFAETEPNTTPLPGGTKVFGKFDSMLLGGSVKVRPAIRIIADAISTGALTQDKIVFEATSGNFGLALALLRRLDLQVVTLVSRKLQSGVLKRLDTEGVKLVDLDMDICPAPGFAGDANLMAAKVVASSVRQQLKDFGLDPAAFDGVRSEVEVLLARQDVIELAKLLAKAYRGFCPQQYDNELNVKAHEGVTGPEICQQLEKAEESPSDYQFVCSFGTGGTATGLGRYVRQEYGTRAVNVVYPRQDQDVAGIRTKEKAVGLRFYRPDEYAAELEADFERARRLMDFMNAREFDIGESGALALYATLELARAGKGKKFVVMIADGASKYAKARLEPVNEVTFQMAAAEKSSYGAVVWTHGSMVLNKKGVNALASALGIKEEAVRIAKMKDIQALQRGGEIPRVFRVSEPGERLLLVCVAGGTSLVVAKLLSQRGITASSLMGGMTGASIMRGMLPFEFLQPATE